MDKLIFRIIGMISAVFVTSSKLPANAVLPSSPSPIATSSTESVVSPDGKVNLTMESEKGDESITYNFTSTNINYTRIVNLETSESIPRNTWSTNDKYAFIKETTQGQTNYWVLPMGINLTDYFNQKLPNYKLTDVTGWAADNLIIINTNNSDNSVGPSFWFDVNSKNFIILATRFN